MAKHMPPNNPDPKDPKASKPEFQSPELQAMVNDIRASYEAPNHGLLARIFGNDKK